MIKVFLEILSIYIKNLYFGHFILISLFSNLSKCSHNKKDCCVCALNIFNINLIYHLKIYNIKQRIHIQQVILTQTHSYCWTQNSSSWSGVDGIIEHKTLQDMIWTLMMLKNTKLFLLGSEASLIVKISERGRIQRHLQQK